MEVTVIKKLNGIEIHPAYTYMGEETPMSVSAIYAFEVPELGYLDRRHLNLVPFLDADQIEYLENAIVWVQNKIEQET